MANAIRRLQALGEVERWGRAHTVRLMWRLLYITPLSAEHGLGTSNMVQPSGGMAETHKWWRHAVMAVSGRKAGMHFKSPTLKSSGDGLKVFCLPCDRDGERLAAHGFCKNCHEHLYIKEFRKEINQRLDELEVQAERRAHETLRENFKNLNKIETACNETTSSIQKSADKIKQYNISKQADELFIELKCAEQMLKEYDKTFADLSNFDIKEYNFKPNETIFTLLKQETFLGRLALTALNTECTAPASQIESNQFPGKENGDICVKTSQDKFSCWITGMTLLTPELLIITDFLNSAVKVVDTSSQSVSVQLQLDVEPWDITAVTNIELAVTLPHKQVIQFLSISTNTLLKKRQLKVDGDCRGISCYQRKLVVSFNNPVKVQIFQRNGTVLNTIENELFRSPLYITTNNQFIYVSDWKMKTVTILNWQYEEIANNTSMDDPKGISLSDDGTVFVSDGVRNVIEEMSGDCSAGEVVRKDLKYPFAVCFCSKTRKLYYSCHSGDFKVDNVLKIFKVPGKI
ncbi:uncharacterized protein LOC132757389 [Ruditapes philippinarum]|uniref:uncharacterized protein LOC132757389 n=1 Tax=Ruditapes philippinarum TaxID=129788 RepID=UPI00295AD958|nr:uncharacterized protein LOC132757389 [Ruditapes philippinarum]